MNALIEHLATGVTTVCRAWILTRADGLVLGFTDHDSTITVDGVACRASTGLTASAISTSTGLSVDNTEASGALSDDSISEDDIRLGRWDGAEVVVYRVNWRNTAERDILIRATLGEISWGDGAFRAELRGLAEQLNKVRGRVYQKRCDASLGDGRCGVVLGEAFVVEARVSDALEPTRYSVIEPAGYAPGWFTGGTLTVLDGASEGVSRRIKLDYSAQGRRIIELWTSIQEEIAPKTRVRLEAGCDKRLTTCREKFGNVLNFRGFPSIPGEEWLMAYPSRHRRNDGGRL